MKLRNIVILLLISSKLSFAQVQEADIKNHISYLADDKLQGREPGTKGEKLAYKYIQKQFEEIGLKPKGSKGYLQHFEYKTLANPHDTIGQGNKKNGSKSREDEVSHYLLRLNATTNPPRAKRESEEGSGTLLAASAPSPYDLPKLAT